MSDEEDFDPTHALDGWRVPAPAPLDLDLRSIGRPAGSGPDEAKRARLKARGYEMVDVEDVEIVERAPAAEVLPVIDLQVPPPAPAPDPQQVIDTVQMPPLAPAPVASEAPLLDLPQAPRPPEPDPQQVIDAVQMPPVAPAPVASEAPPLDLPKPPPPPEPDPRLLAAWAPGCWTVRVHRLAEASVEVRQQPSGLQVEHHPAQWLCALWSPVPDPHAATAGDPWPDGAGVFGADSVDGALRQGLAALEPDARLWAADDGADWGLVAELVLAQHEDLRAGPAQALGDLVEQARLARQQRLGQGYRFQDGLARRRS